MVYEKAIMKTFHPQRMPSFGPWGDMICVCMYIYKLRFW